MALSALDRLRLFLRPPGRGIATFSTGAGFASPLLKKLYGTDEGEAVAEAWEETLQRIRRVEAILIGIPCDTGAGLLRGAAFGPLGIRMAYLERYGSYPKGVIDIGDVLCIPQLLHDSMLSEAQKLSCRQALFPGAENEELPVSPLSVAEAALKTILELNPKARLAVLGGDHSVSWPAIRYCQERLGQDYAVLHFDAHSDLLEKRLGISYCFATWAFHAQKAMKPGHLVQVGLRASTRSREQWEAQLPVRQFWAAEIRGREEASIQQIIEHLQSLGTTRVYVSNDIDGTDALFAPATGTPEGSGLEPKFVRALIAEVRRHFDVFGGDLTEVAPPLSGSLDFVSDRTCQLAADYLHSLIG
jgi:arginase family enzyme